MAIGVPQRAASRMTYTEAYFNSRTGAAPARSKAPAARVAACRDVVTSLVIGALFNQPHVASVIVFDQSRAHGHH